MAESTDDFDNGTVRGLAVKYGLDPTNTPVSQNRFTINRPPGGTRSHLRAEEILLGRNADQR